MTQYQCRICNYKFESTKTPKRCPYCSRVGTAQPVPQASDILEEVEKQGQEEE